MDEGELQLSNLKEIITQYSKAGNYIEGIPYMERYVILIKEKYGAESDRYVTVINDLGGMYRNIGDFNKASETFHLAQDIVEKKLGKRCEQYATITVNLACMYRFTNEFEKAEKMFLDALSIYDENEEMQEILQQAQSCPSAMEMIERRKTITKDVVRKSTLYANASNNLGTLYQDMRNFDKAIECHNRSLELLKNTSNFEYVAITLNNLVNPLIQTGKLQEALNLVKSSLEIFEKHLSKKHPFYLTALNNEGTIYFYAGYPEKSLEVFEKVEKYLKNTYGINSPQYKACLKNIEEAKKKQRENSREK